METSRGIAVITELVVVGLKLGDVLDDAQFKAIQGLPGVAQATEDIVDRWASGARVLLVEFLRTRYLVSFHRKVDATDRVTWRVTQITGRIDDEE